MPHHGLIQNTEEATSTPNFALGSTKHLRMIGVRDAKTTLSGGMRWCICAHPKALHPETIRRVPIMRGALLMSY